MKSIKKIVCSAAALVLALLSGCTQSNPAVPKTVAVRLSEDRQSERGYRETSLYSTENLAAYHQEDGSTVIYLYSAPLEKNSVSIKPMGETSFCSVSRYTTATFPSVVSAEAPLSFFTSGQSVGVLPSDGEPHAGKLVDQIDAFGQKRQAVQYDDFFGEGLDCLCTPTSFGVNTELILKKKPESNTFRLRVVLPGLSPDTGSPDYILMKDASGAGTVKTILYTPLAVDKNGSWSYQNQIRLIEKEPDSNTYTVEYTIDREFLENPKTKYPLILHQSLYNYKAKQPDTSVYSETGDIAGHYLSPYLLLGDATLKGEGWTYIRYETLEELEIEADDLVSAKYLFRNLFDLPEEATIGAYAVTADWCSINTRWFNRPTNDDKPISLVSVRRRGDYELDVTTLLREMIKNKGRDDARYSIQNGFLIRCDTPGRAVMLASGDNGFFSPCLELVVNTKKEGG